MLGLFRKLLSRPARPPAAPPVRPSAPAAASRPAQRAMPVPVLKNATRPAPVSPPPPLAPRPPVSMAAPGTGAQVKIALADLVAGLPESVRHVVAAVPNQFVSIPADHLLPQLGQGSVLLTVAELRVFSPDHFSSLSGHDQTAVALPLVEILRQIPPAQYARRNQKHIEVPDEISALFSPTGKGLSVSKPAAPPTTAVRPQPTVTASAPPPAPVVQAPAPVPAPVQQAGKISMSPTALAALAAMNSPATAQAPAPNRPVVRLTPLPTIPTVNPLPRQTSPSSPVPTVNGNGNDNGAAPHGTNGSNGNGNGNGSLHTHGASNGAPKLSGESLVIPLAAVAPAWVQEVRAALATVDMDQARILVPIELLEAAMKTGKVFFRWAELATWVQPALADAPTGKLAETTLELPLKVIAPLFMARHRGAAQKKAAVDESIPDLFDGGKSSVQAQVPQRASVEPMTAPARSITPASAVPTPVSVAPVAPGISLEQVIGPAAKRLAAREIIANTARLPGLSGAILVMSDGLLVTNATPAAVKAETIAAFVPQMFGRMNQYTKELTLGPLHHLTLGIEGGQWHFLKSGSLYLAVLGKPGETLPLNMLAQIAAELSSQSQ